MKLNRNFATKAALFIAALAFVGCSDVEDSFESWEGFPAGQIFDFSTVQNANFNVQLGANAAKDVICAYSSKEAAQHVVKYGHAGKFGQGMLFSYYLDANGEVSANVQLPKGLETIYLASPTDGDLGVVEVPVVNGIAKLNGPRRAAEGSSKNYTLCDVTAYVTGAEVNSKSKGWYSSDYASSNKTTKANAGGVKKTDMGNFYTLGTWEPVACSNKTSAMRYGAFTDVNGICETDELIKANAKDLFITFQKAQQADKTEYADESKVNLVLSVKEPVTEWDEDLHVNKTTTYLGNKIWFTSIAEDAAYQNVVGYYIYKTDAEPKSVAEALKLDKFLIVPNGSTSVCWDVSTGNETTSFPYRKDNTTISTSSTDLPKAYAPMTAGQRIQLLFKDPDTGEVSDIFPAGYTVGFFLAPNGYDSGWKINSDNGYATGVSTSSTQKTAFHFPQFNKTVMTGCNISAHSCFINSDSNFNADVVNQRNSGQEKYKTRFSFLEENLYGHNLRVYGIEDGSDWDYNDFTFVVEQEELKKVEYDGIPEYEEEWHIVNSYAYEDIWPVGGDFDLNDIVIEHWQKQFYNLENKLTKVYDVFQITSLEAAASFHDAFFVQIPEGQQGKSLKMYDLAGKTHSMDDFGAKGDLLAEGDAAFESATNSLIIFNDQHADLFDKGRIGVVVERDFTDLNVDKSTLDYNPYVISRWDITKKGVSGYVPEDIDGSTAVAQQYGYVFDLSATNRMEIHLPGFEVTQYGIVLPEKSNTEMGFYANKFVSAGSKYPFAIALKSVSGWQYPNPGVKVSDTFIHYDAWTKSAGAEWKDWYLNKHDYDVRY